MRTRLYGGVGGTSRRLLPLSRFWGKEHRDSPRKPPGNSRRNNDSAGIYNSEWRHEFRGRHKAAITQACLAFVIVHEDEAYDDEADGPDPSEIFSCLIVFR